MGASCIAGASGDGGASSKRVEKDAFSAMDLGLAGLLVFEMILVCRGEDVSVVEEPVDVAGLEAALGLLVTVFFAAGLGEGFGDDEMAVSTTFLAVVSGEGFGDDTALLTAGFGEVLGETVAPVRTTLLVTDVGLPPAGTPFLAASVGDVFGDLADIAFLIDGLGPWELAALTTPFLVIGLGEAFGEVPVDTAFFMAGFGLLAGLVAVVTPFLDAGRGDTAGETPLQTGLGELAGLITPFLEDGLGLLAAGLLIFLAASLGEDAGDSPFLTAGFGLLVAFATPFLEEGFGDVFGEILAPLFGTCRGDDGVVLVCIELAESIALPR